MTDHAHYRLVTMIDPLHRESSSQELHELAVHRETCAECERYHEAMSKFESRLERAMKVDVLGRDNVGLLGGRATPPSRGRHKQWLALAASLLLGVIVVSGGWLASPSSSLAADVVMHVAKEPLSEAPVGPIELQRVLQSAQVQMLPSAGTVTYARRCPFHGHIVPHLVIQSTRGLVTVMVLVNESVRRPVDLNGEGYRGVIIPIEGHGSLAILARADNWKDINDTVTQMRGALHYTTKANNS